MKWQLFWSLLSIACFAYGIVIFAGGSGTLFYLIWIAGGIICAGAAAAAGWGLWGHLPAAARGLFLIVLLCAAGFFVSIEMRIISAFHPQTEQGLDYLVVLGAQVRDDGPSNVLRYRLDAAAGYLKNNKETLCIVTGGKGENEPFTEAEGMRDYLLSKGVDEKRILLENEAVNTYENMIFSMRLFDPSKDRVGIVTNNFHIYRAMRLARKAGIVHAFPVSTGSSPGYLPNNLLREFFGVVKEYVQGNI